MRTHLRLLVVSSVTLALGFWLLAGAGSGVADDKKEKKDNGPQADIRKIADLFEQGDLAGAKAQAKASAGKIEDLEEVMNLFALRKADGKGGEGIGPKPGAIKPDGIEAKLQNLTKRVLPNELKNDNAALQRMAYIAAAIAEIAQSKCPVDKKMGEKDPAEWKKWSEEMSASALELAKSIKAGNATDVKKVALRLDGTCRNCHGVFRTNN
jgi:hypothetical protein